MSKQAAWRGAKRLLALILALVIAVNGQIGYGFTVEAAQSLEVTLYGFTENTETGEYFMEYSGSALETNDIMVTVKDDVGADITADARITWTKDNETVSQITDAGTYYCRAEFIGETGTAALIVTQKELAIA